MLGKEHPDIASTTSDMAHAFQSRGKWMDAIKLYEQCLAIREKALGKNHAGYLGTLDRIARCYVQLGEHGTALDLLR